MSKIKVIVSVVAVSAGTSYYAVSKIKLNKEKKELFDNMQNDIENAITGATSVISIDLSDESMEDFNKCIEGFKKEFKTAKTMKVAEEILKEEIAFCSTIEKYMGEYKPAAKWFIRSIKLGYDNGKIKDKLTITRFLLASVAIDYVDLLGSYGSLWTGIDRYASTISEADCDKLLALL